jgi:hypothetical protein
LAEPNLYDRKEHTERIYPTGEKEEKNPACGKKFVTVSLCGKHVP